jgi:hypothetical protein
MAESEEIEEVMLATIVIKGNKSILRIVPVLRCDLSTKQQAYHS